MDAKVLEAARQAFPAGGDALTLGAVLHEGACDPEPIVRLPLAMANRHGLIAGATGTGKTKSLQLLAEQFSAAGVPVFLADLKGDLSGIAVAGKSDDRIQQRAKDTGYAWKPQGCPVEYLSLTGANGAQLRATVSSFGPLLLSRVLGLNDTQSSVLSLVFKYCDDKHLPLLNLSDLRAVLQHLTGDGADELKDYGGMSKATVGVLLREMVGLEQQGADAFFGEPEFELEDLLKVDNGRGLVSVLELSDVQEKPALFSTFMMWMLARLYHDLPEMGDVAKPKLVFFFDEAHLLFDDASKAFLDQVEQVVRLIRSKGVGIYFVTQNPKDVPNDVLGQLGHRIQHALRAFTPDDEKALAAAARTFPRTPFYEVDKVLTSLGIGEAFVTVLTPNGTPTMPFAVRMAPPSSRMGPLTADEFKQHLQISEQVQHYATAIDRESAREMLSARVAASVQASQAAQAAQAPAAPPPGGGATMPAGTGEAIAGAAAVVGAAMSSPIVRAMATSVARSVGTQLARGLMGALLGAPTRRRR